MKTDRVLKFLNIGANLAVLAGLIFVGMEVRDGRAAAQAQVADGLADGFLQLNIAGVEDPAVACLWVVGLERPESLDSMEAVRFSLYTRGIFNQYQRVWAQHRTGLVTDEYWELISGEVAWVMATPGGRLYLRDNPQPNGFLESIVPTGGDFSFAGMTMGLPSPDSCS